VESAAGGKRQVKSEQSQNRPASLVSEAKDREYFSVEGAAAEVPHQTDENCGVLVAAERIFGDRPKRIFDAPRNLAAVRRTLQIRSRHVYNRKRVPRAQIKQCVGYAL